MHLCCPWNTINCQNKIKNPTAHRKVGWYHSEVLHWAIIIWYFTCSSTYKFAIWVNKTFIYMVNKFCKALVGLLLGYKSIILFTLTFMLVRWADGWYCQTPSWARKPNQLISSSGLSLWSLLPIFACYRSSKLQS